MWQKRFLAAFVLAATLLTVLLAGFYVRDYSAGRKEGKKKFGAIYMTMNNPFYRTMDLALRQSIEAKDDILLCRDAALSPERQREEAEALIEEGCAVLFLNAVDERAAADIVRIAERKGVLVIAVDTRIEGAAPPVTVTSSNYETGKSLATHLLSVRTSANIVLLEHDEAASARERIQGFLDGIAGRDGFLVVGRRPCYGQLEKAMPQMEVLLREHPELDVVVALNDPAAMGAIAALEHAQRLENTLVYGVDGVPEARELVRSGRLTATAEQDPREMARLAAQEAYRLLEKAGQQATLPSVGAPALHELPTRLLTLETVERGGADRWE
ncbi:sugar ABC transporter substrate-binding protein [Selenomonas sp. TAMA-11512]|uniref:substrate-binding domain-containing protein n=1 Tax=Selenomonas sp. TAMA-11512 TaxID=3095337 RepID=UPI003092D907|nr:sugar ABC transporter substrate-binding protein [Selenomonas sp. TAMA-11512]